MRSPYQKVIVYDLETGGFDVNKNAISDIALYAIDMRDLEIVDEYTSLIHPYLDYEYDQEALAVTGLSVQELRSKGTHYATVCGEVKAFIQKHTVGNSKPLLVGHNIHKFDNNFLIKFFRDCGEDLGKLTPLDDSIDTLKESRKIYYELANYSLGTVANAMNLTLVEAHRAAPDALMNAKVFIKMIKNYRGFGQVAENYVRRKYDFNY